MSKFVQSSTGQYVDSSIATYSGGRIKPGFHEMLDDGERISFDICLIDAARNPKHTTLNDIGSTRVIYNGKFVEVSTISDQRKPQTRAAQISLNDAKVAARKTFAARQFALAHPRRKEG